MRLGISLSAMVIGSALMWTPALAQAGGCAEPPSSPLVINVKDKGAKGDGKTDDSEAIRDAVGAVAGTGGTVFVPDGVYMIDAVRQSLSS